MNCKSSWSLQPGARQRIHRVVREGYHYKSFAVAEAFAEGPLAGVRVEPETFRRALRLYHQMEGWDPESGWPTFAKMAELGIEWAAKPGDSW